MKRYAVIAALLALMLVPNLAHAICTTVSITTSSTKLLAANDIGGNPGRHLLQLVGGSSCPVYCDVDVSAAVALSGYVVPTAGMVTIPATQTEGRTYPATPNGAIYCIVPSNMGCASQSVSACDF